MRYNYEAKILQHTIANRVVVYVACWSPILETAQVISDKRALTITFEKDAELDTTLGSLLPSLSVVNVYDNYTCLPTINITYTFDLEA